jgi:lauroyl/myristoyl acyltransferase
LNIDLERYWNRPNESKVRKSWFAYMDGGGYTEISVKAETAPVASAGSAGPRSPMGDPERRHPGRLRRLLAAARFDGLWWRKFARLGCVYGPEWWKRGSPPVIALTLFLLVGRNRRGAIENQRRALGDVAYWRAVVGALRVFTCFARCFTETMEFYGPRPRPFRIDEPKRNHVADAIERGRGVILATAHVGNWDISGRALHGSGRPVHLVMAREPNETTQEYARRSREQAGVQVIFSDSSVFSAFNMIRTLRRNEILAIQIDRGNGETSPPARGVEFLGATALFQEGPFHLARLSGAPVVPVVTLRRGLRHYEVVLGEPLTVSREIPGDAERALRDAAAFFERTIREDPRQWFQFEPFWATGK